MRFLAPAVGVLLLVASGLSTPLLLLIVAFGTEIPDATAPEGDPCCTPPSSWGQVAFGVAWAIGSVGLVAAAATTGLWLLGPRRRTVRLRRLLRAPLIAMAITAIGLALAILPRAHQARTTSTCTVHQREIEACR